MFFKIILILTISLATVFGNTLTGLFSGFGEVKGFSFFRLGSDCDKSKCEPIPKHYEELGCLPIKKDGECCTQSYDCKQLEARDDKKCHFKGKIFDNDGVVDDSLLNGSCEGFCHCKDKKFNCMHINCPENFGPRPEVGCVRQYSNDKCCSVGTVCGEEAKKLATCEFEGKTYKEGERMQSQDFKCHKCVCTASFENKTVAENKDCVKIDCNIELFETDNIKDGCVPIYHKDSCCPYDWRCPSSSDAIVPINQDAKHDQSSPKCRFGKLSLEIGDALSSGESGCSKCSCKTPPMADCVFTGC